MKTKNLQNSVFLKIGIVSIILTLASFIRLLTLNDMGRTWDEPVYVSWGYKTVDLIKKGDFNNSFLYLNPGFPPMSKYLYGTASHFDVKSFDNFGNPNFNYDYTYARLVSVLLSSLTSILILLFGWKYFSMLTGILASGIYSLLPLSVGYGQIATLESLILFSFTLSFVCFIEYLNSHSKKFLILTGITLGIALSVKFTNILLIVLFSWVYAMWFLSVKPANSRIITHFKHLVIIFFIGSLVFLALWPMPWFHLDYVIPYNLALRNSPYSVPEVFFGKLLLVPKAYYLVYFVITTPVLILAFFILGMIKNTRKSDMKITMRINKKLLAEFFLLSVNKTKWVYYSTVVWFMLPFIQSLYNFRQHGVRYIIEIYSPLSILSAIGIVFFLEKFALNKKAKIFFISSLLTYLIIILINQKPYYLDYFNEITGGTGYVYKTRMFQMGWWGQGIKEAADFIEKNAPVGSTIGIAVSPTDVLPEFENYIVEEYNPSKKYDYVLVNYYNIIREGFKDKEIRKNYKTVYKVTVDSAVLATVYKSK